MLPRALRLAAPAARHRVLPRAALQHRRNFLPTPSDLQKALEEAQQGLMTAAQKAKEESEKAAKVIGESLPMGSEQGKQAMQMAQQTQQELLEKAQVALEKAKEEAEKAAQVVNETMQQVAKGQAPAGLDEGKVHVVKGLEAAAEQGAQIVNAALAAAGSQQRFGGPAGELDAAAPVVGARPPEGSSLFWNPDMPNSPSKVGRSTFISRSLKQAEDPCAMVPEADVEQYVDFLLTSAVLGNNALPQAMGKQYYLKIVRLVQRALVAMLSSFEGQVMGREMRLLWSSSSLNVFRPSTAASLDPQLVKCLAKRALKGQTGVPAYLEDLGLDKDKVQDLYQDIVALSVRLMMDISLMKQIRILGHEVSMNIVPDELLITAPGWEAALEEGVFGLFGEEEKDSIAKEFVEAAMQDPALKMTGVSDAVRKEMYMSVVKVLLSLSEVALNHFRVHVAGMAFRPALMEKKEPTSAATSSTGAPATPASPGA